MKIDLKTAGAIVATAVTIAVPAALWFPSMAEEKVAIQSALQEKTDKVQDVDIRDLRSQVFALTVAQGITNTELNHLTEAVKASTKKDDELKLEIQQLIKAIE